MKIAVLGATGQTGQELVRQAVETGHSVIAVVRNADKLKVKNDKLQVVTGDIFSADSVSPHFKDVDVVVSCLGFPREKTVSGYTESMKAIAQAVKSQNVKRLVTMTAFFTDTSSAKNQGFFVNWVLIPFLKPILTNMREMEILLESEHKDLNWTVVRPPGLGSGPVSGRPVRTEEDKFFTAGHGAKRMPRADVAKIMLEIATSDRFVHKCVAIDS